MTGLSALRAFVTELRRLDWDACAEVTHRDVRAILHRVNERQDLVSEIARWDSATVASTAPLCHETSTHYKWALHRDADDRFCVWLHEYKPRAKRRVGHANVAHNHRYCFSSLVLAGSLEEVTYDPRNGAPFSVARTQLLRAGATYSVMSDEIHAMREIAEGTCTVVVQGRAERHFSTVYDVTTGDSTDYPDFIAQHATLATKLLEVAGAAPARSAAVG